MALVVFLLGASLGSFLMVWVDRGSLARSVVGRSKCDRCGHVLRALHLIPVLSWLWLRGRCASCHRSLSRAYPLVECGLGLALSFVWIHAVGFGADPLTIDASMWTVVLQNAVLTILLALLFLYDLRRGLLPDRITIPAIIAMIIWHGLQGRDGQDILLGALVVGGFFLAQFLVSRGRWVGGGDMRMGVLLGVMLGLVGGLEALGIAYVLGACVGLWLLAFRGATRKTPLPFGTFLAIGGYVVLVFGVSAPIAPAPLTVVDAPGALPQSDERIVPIPTTTITFVGDIMLAREVERALIKNGVDWPFAQIKDAWTGSDLVVGNYEATIRDTYRYEGEVLAFDVLPELNSGLKTAGFTHLSLANNHGDDFGAAVTERTRQTIEALGIATFGDPIESERHVARVESDIPISLIGFHAFLEEPSSLVEVIKEENRLGRFVIVMPHWGNEYQPLPSIAQRDAANIFIEAGADLIIGGHPHVVQPIDTISSVLVAWSLGNFVFDQDWSVPTQEGMMLTVTVTDETVTIAPTPISIKGRQALRMSEPRASEMLKTVGAPTGAITVDRAPSQNSNPSTPSTINSTPIPTVTQPTTTAY